MVTKVKNSNFYKTKETQILTKLKLKKKMVTKLENSNYDKTQKHKMWQNMKDEKSQFIKKEINFKKV